MRAAYYQDAAVTLYHGDIREIIEELPAYDHYIADPPYDPKTHTGAQSKLRPNYKVSFAPIDPAEVVFIARPKRWALSFCSLEMLGRYADAAGDGWVRSGIWDRINGAPQLTGDRPAQGAECIAIWHPDPGVKKWNGGGKQAKWRHLIVRGDDRVHETQKPLALMRDLILDFTDVGDLIVDTFAGSGTTGVAAKECGRRCILIEQQEEHCASAAIRLERASLDERIATVPGQRGKQAAIPWGE